MNRSPIDRLADLTIPDASGCWLFTGSLNAKGYGQCGAADGLPAGAHRRAYVLAYGPLPPDLDVHHVCHVRRCVYPGHLRAVSHERNTQEREGADVRSLTGVRGVSLVGSRYRVTVKHRGKNHWGGSFATLEEAAARAIEFRREVFSRHTEKRP